MEDKQEIDLEKQDSEQQAEEGAEKAPEAPSAEAEEAESLEKIKRAYDGRLEAAEAKAAEERAALMGKIKERDAIIADLIGGGDAPRPSPIEDLITRNKERKRYN